MYIAQDGYICDGCNVITCLPACLGDTCNCTNGDIRLVGGPSSREGRVELCLNGMWGTICDSFWNNQDAVVVCRQLGYSQTGENCICIIGVFI